MEKTFNFNDIFNSGFLANVAAISFTDMVIAIGLAFIIGLFVKTVYKKTFKGVMYSKTFGVSLMSMTMITTFIILAITSNVVLSLGMVGALSIVRFRSAVKEPIDIAFLFWAIAEGIVIGAGLITLALVGAVIIGLIMVIFVNKDSVDNPYILVVNFENNKIQKNILACVENNVKRYVIKSKTSSAKAGVEITIELRLKDMTTDFVDEISELNGVSNAVLVAYNGEYME